MNELQVGATRESVYEYVKSKYDAEPEYLWRSAPRYAVFRRADNQKWYAIIMDVQKCKLGLRGDERVEILDIKCPSGLRDVLLQQNGFLPAYHMSREHWITVLLDGSVENQTVFGLLDESYELAENKTKKPGRNTPPQKAQG